MIGAVFLVLGGLQLVSIRALLENSIFEAMSFGLGLMSLGLAGLTLAYGFSGERVGSDYIRCPSCRESIDKSALTCPHCGEHIRGDYVGCPECLEPIKRLATTCPHCGSDLIEDAQTIEPDE